MFIHKLENILSFKKGKKFHHISADVWGIKNRSYLKKTEKIRKNSCPDGQQRTCSRANNALVYELFGAQAAAVVFGFFFFRHIRSLRANAHRPGLLYSLQFKGLYNGHTGFCLDIDYILFYRFCNFIILRGGSQDAFTSMPCWGSFQSVFEIRFFLTTVALNAIKKICD